MPVVSGTCRSTVMHSDSSGKLIFKGDLSPLCRMNKFVTNKSKLPQDGAQVFSYMG